MKSFRLIQPYFYQRRHLIIAGIICLMGVDTLQLFIPRIIKWAVDDLTSLKIDIRQLSIYAGEIICIAVLMAALRFVWRRFLIGTSRVIERELRNKLFSHIQTLSAGYFDQTKTGDLMAHATNDINNIRMAVGMGMVALTDAVFLGSAAICFMAYINIKLTLFALIPMPVIVWFTRSFGKKMHRRYTNVQATFSELTESVRESFSGIRIVKAFNREKSETDRVAAVSEKYIQENLKLVKITGSFFPMMILFTNISLTIVIYLGGRQTITTTITPGDFVAFISYLNLLTWPMMAMGWVTNLIQRGSASIDRINKILHTPPEIIENPEIIINTDAAVKKQITGEVQFRNVGFSYKSSNTPVLSDINFNVCPGSVLGIIGPQGSGKTTLLQLIPRIYDISSGSIMIDNLDIKKFKLNDLRKNIGFVSQEPFLFSGSIRDNITFGETIAEEKIIQATKAAAMYETITGFADGLETIIGEKGVILSGGQKQRIVLSRALIHNPPVLLLDDPIGQVDTQTAAAIIRTIRFLSRNKTIIIVSHRLSAVGFADHIIVLDAGRITESGSHETLVASNNYYAKSYFIQRAEQPE
ncbi:MAG: ABC transporter ATP-binding protein [Desulfobacteraceae bacterium]|nr:ABC transporter ATP-binding protein [Desulfobacteraceae bacterium]MBC2755998.1 ABC transporter ATP-binding protein [Desulfobacteraceae bacterium]